MENAEEEMAEDVVYRRKSEKANLQKTYRKFYQKKFRIQTEVLPLLNPKP